MSFAGLSEDAGDAPLFSVRYRPYAQEWAVVNLKTGFAESVHSTRDEAWAMATILCISDESSEGSN